MAMAIQMLLSNRLTAARKGHATVLYDMRNALFCSRHGQIDELLKDIARPEDYPLLTQRYRQAVLRFQDGYEHFDLALGSGMPPGDSIAGKVFTVVFHPMVDRWLERTEDLAVELTLDIGGLKLKGEVG
eukprot:1784233-Heterocapsa_arctica.AAC.1